MPANREPTMRAAWLGEELRTLRESLGIPAKDIGAYLNKSQPSISRLENGLYPAQEHEVKAYLDICGVKDESRRADLFRMCDDVAQRGWWDGYGRDVAGVLMDRTWVEARATHIQTHNITCLPGLLQTPEYAQALFRISNPEASNREVAQWMDFRMTRQHVLTRHKPVELNCLLDEHLLTRRAEDTEVMRGQLDFLLVAADRANVTVRVLPADECNGVTGPFEIMKLVEPYPRVGFAATLAGDICVEGEPVDYFTQMYDRLIETAWSPQESKARIETERNKL